MLKAWSLHSILMILICGAIVGCSGQNPTQNNSPAIPLDSETDIETTHVPVASSTHRDVVSEAPIQKKPSETYREELLEAASVWQKRAKETLSTMKDLESLFPKKIQCLDQEHCPDSIGGVIALSEQYGSYIGSYSCTVVLIARDIAMTNRHCTKESHFFLFAFPKTKNAEAEYATSSLLIGENPVPSEPFEVDPDYAFIKLDRKLKRKPAPLNRNGFRENETFTVIGPSPYGDHKSPDLHIVEPRKCLARYDSALSPFFNHPLDSHIALSDCPIGPGGSGSPIYNQKGELVGIIAGQLSQQVLIQEAYGFMSVGGLLSEDQARHKGWGTNLACIPSIDDSYLDLPQECFEDYDSENPSILKIASTDHKRLSQKIQDWTSPQWGEFRLAQVNKILPTSLNTLDATFFTLPKCIHRMHLNLFSSEYQGALISFELDGDFIRTGNVSDWKTFEAKIKIDLEKLKLNNKTDLYLHSASFYPDLSPIRIGEISFCLDQE